LLDYLTEYHRLGYTDSVTMRRLTANGASAGGGRGPDHGSLHTSLPVRRILLASVEYSGDCYCGNATSNGGGPAPDGLTERWYPMAMVTANRSILVVGGKMTPMAHRFPISKLSQNPLTPAWFTATGSIAQIQQSLSFLGSSALRWRLCRILQRGKSLG